jgi:DHA1 family bicyclomycin/chloramphenicol resistance-like MFS transporter
MVGGVGMIIGRAVVRDCFSGRPGAARHECDHHHVQPRPGAGAGDWRLDPRVARLARVFGSMAMYALVLAWMVYRRLPETLGLAHRTPLEFGALAGNLYRVARHPEFLLLTTASGLCFVVLQIYVGSAPAIILDHWGGSEVGFAMLTVPIISGYAIGAVASGRMAGRLPPARQANYGYTLLLAATGAMLVLQRFVDRRRCSRNNCC